MKIFSSFDTRYKRKLITEKQSQFWVNNVHLIRRSQLFLFVKVQFPIILSLIVGIATTICIDYFLHIEMIWSILTGILFFVGMLIPYRVLKHFIDYHMDYCIITPNEIILAEQSGLFKRQMRTLDATKIKSISVQKKRVFKSIFNNGAIVFMSDGDDHNLWEIDIDYVYNPEEHKTTINHIINHS